MSHRTIKISVMRWEKRIDAIEKSVKEALYILGK